MNLYLVSDWCWDQGFDKEQYREGGCVPLKAFKDEADAVIYAQTKTRETIAGEHIGDFLAWAVEFDDAAWESNKALACVLESWQQEYLKGYTSIEAPESISDWLDVHFTYLNEMPGFVLDVLAKETFQVFYRIEETEVA